MKLTSHRVHYGDQVTVDPRPLPLLHLLLIHIRRQQQRLDSINQEYCRVGTGYSSSPVQNSLQTARQGKGEQPPNQSSIMRSVDPRTGQKVDDEGLLFSGEFARMHEIRNLIGSKNTPQVTARPIHEKKNGWMTVGGSIK